MSRVTINNFIPLFAPEQKLNPLRICCKGGFSDKTVDVPVDDIGDKKERSFIASPHLRSREHCINVRIVGCIVQVSLSGRIEFGSNEVRTYVVHHQCTTNSLVCECC